MKVLVTGVAGQLGCCLRESCPEGVELVGADLEQCDLARHQEVLDYVDSLQPQVIINAAAYTAVDRAESEPEKAWAVNADGARHIAEAANAIGARLIHISTDFVFDGLQSTPYRPEDSPSPISVYGTSKLAGERAVAAATREQALIIRTAWVYSRHGNNFVKTMLRLLSERDEVRVVADQIGTPTSAHSLAHTLWSILDQPDLSGLAHWTEAGVASWYDLAHAVRVAMQKTSGSRRLARLVPISTAEYRLPAQRPAYSVLDKTFLWQALGVAQHWRESLDECILSIASDRP